MTSTQSCGKRNFRIVGRTLTILVLLAAWPLVVFFISGMLMFISVVGSLCWVVSCFAVCWADDDDETIWFVARWGWICPIVFVIGINIAEPFGNVVCVATNYYSDFLQSIGQLLSL